MINPTWDLNVSPGQFRKVLKNPRSSRFNLYFARVLSRVPFYEVFHRFITPRQFIRHYPRIRRWLVIDLFGAGRLRFWDWLYRRLA